MKEVLAFLSDAVKSCLRGARKAEVSTVTCTETINRNSMLAGEKQGAALCFEGAKGSSHWRHVRSLFIVKNITV